MTGLEIFFGIVLLLFSIAIILVILLQEGQQQQTGTISSGSDTFLDRNRTRSIDAFLERWTKFISFGFMITVIVINIVSYFTK